jgi:hemerythrin
MHFESEEHLLDRQGFPGLEEHRSAHELLMTKLYASLDQASNDEVVPFSSLLGFLPSWYSDHVEQLDQPYGTWMNEHGVY